ncbi:MAG: amidohydrolase family protein [Burkholderiales bacterium]|nr:amidohydrolase family protein [Burkholderiales bacterium]
MVNVRVSGIVLSAFLAVATWTVHAATPFIDTQAQFEIGVSTRNYVEISDAIVAEMDKWGVRMTLLVPPPQPSQARFRQDIEDYLPVLKKHPGRFAALGGGGSINRMILESDPQRVGDGERRALRARVGEILAAGAVGLGEVTSAHFSLPKMFQGHAYSATAPDHPLLLELADIAAERNVPIDIHFDVVPRDMPVPAHLANALNPAQLKANLPQFERFVAHNRKASIVWSHAGSDPGRQRSVEMMQDLLARHPNLYMSIRPNLTGPLPTVVLDSQGALKAEWRKLFLEFPDRFMMQTDAFYRLGTPIVQFGGVRAMEFGRALLDQLPDEVAAKIGHANAQRLYRLGN